MSIEQWCNFVKILFKGREEVDRIFPNQVKMTVKNEPYSTIRAKFMLKKTNSFNF